MRLRGEFPIESDEDRVKLIANLVEEGSQSPIIRQLSLDILRKNRVREKDSLGEIKAIFDWVKKNIQYRGDVFCRDSYHHPERIIELEAGDCDDMCLLLDSMLASIGFSIGCRIITMNPNKGFHHIYSLVGVKTHEGMKWLPLDAVDKSNGVGDEPRWVKKRDFLFVCGE